MLKKSCFSLKAKKTLLHLYWFMIMETPFTITPLLHTCPLQVLFTLMLCGLLLKSTASAHHCALYGRAGWLLLATLRLTHSYTLIYKAIPGMHLHILGNVIILNKVFQIIIYYLVAGRSSCRYSCDFIYLFHAFIWKNSSIFITDLCSYPSSWYIDWYVVCFTLSSCSVWLILDYSVLYLCYVFSLCPAFSMIKKIMQVK